VPLGWQPRKSSFSSFFHLLLSQRDPLFFCFCFLFFICPAVASYSCLLVALFPAPAGDPPLVCLFLNYSLCINFLRFCRFRLRPSCGFAVYVSFLRLCPFVSATLNSWDLPLGPCCLITAVRTAASSNLGPLLVCSHLCILAGPHGDPPFPPCGRSLLKDRPWRWLSYSFL